jgi:hypothetical protein
MEAFVFQLSDTRGGHIVFRKEKGRFGVTQYLISSVYILCMIKRGVLQFISLLNDSAVDFKIYVMILKIRYERSTVVTITSICAMIQSSTDFY